MSNRLLPSYSSIFCPFELSRLRLASSNLLVTETSGNFFGEAAWFFSPLAPCLLDCT